MLLIQSYKQNQTNFIHELKVPNRRQSYKTLNIRKQYEIHIGGKSVNVIN